MPLVIYAKREVGQWVGHLFVSQDQSAEYWETQRLAGGTIHSQRQQDQLTPEIARGKGKNISNKNQGYLTSSEQSSPTTESLEYNNTLENQESILKSYLMKRIESFKENNNNSLKEIQGNTR